jgi:HlyD family secretion protein
MSRALPWIVVLLGTFIAIRIGLGTFRARPYRLPPGFAYGHGLLEADEINIDTKFAARVAAVYVREGDVVRAGQVLVSMASPDLDAQRRSAEAQVEEAVRLVDEDSASLIQQESALHLARVELERYRQLRAQDFVTQEDLDQRQQTLDAATATVTAMIARVQEAQQAREASAQTLEVLRVDLADDTLRAPRDGRVLYQIAYVGEVLPAGSRVLTMLDGTSVYMDIYLRTLAATRVRLGADGRIVLDGDPEHPIPAFVSYLASQAQFTPKTVETKTERDSLMFRVTVRIDRRVLRTRSAEVHPGLPGVAYVRLDSSVAWPSPTQLRAVLQSSR